MTRLTDTIYLLYSQQTADTDKLTRVITERRKAAWINELTTLAKRHGCSRYAGTPKGEDARELTRTSQTDADGISRTYNRELRNQIERIYRENPRANRNAYYKALEAWAKQRDSWKTLQIALHTDSTARQFAHTRFYQQNPAIAQRFAAAGPPAVCRICLKIFADGVVDFMYTQKHPFPAHINCPHSYKAIAPVRAACDALWLG
jgi:hypothetical protein